MLPPVVALLLGALGVLSPRAAVWAAFGLGLAVLAAQGLVFARVERLGQLQDAPSSPRISGSAFSSSR